MYVNGTNSIFACTFDSFANHFEVKIRLGGKKKKYGWKLRFLLEKKANEYRVVYGKSHLNWSEDSRCVRKRAWARDCVRAWASVLVNNGGVCKPFVVHGTHSNTLCVSYPHPHENYLMAVCFFFFSISSLDVIAAFGSVGRFWVFLCLLMIWFWYTRLAFPYLVPIFLWTAHFRN